MDEHRPAYRTSRRSKRSANRRTWLVVAVAAVALIAVAGAGVRAIGSGWAGRAKGTVPGRAEGGTLPSTPGTPSTAASSQGSTAPAVPEPKAITIGWVGDTTPGSKYGNPPDGGKALFAKARSLTRKPDLMIGNLEGTFGTGGPSKCDGRDSSACFAFQARPGNAAALSWAGFDLMSLANNHANDYFEAGLSRTKKELDRNGIDYTGMPGQITVRDVDGVKVAVIGVSPYPWNQSIADISAAKRLVQKASRKADVVVVVMHAGAEGADKTRTPKGAEYAYGEFRGDTRRFAHAMVDSGADLVLGSGPHVVRGVERYKDRLIAYSLGNFGGWKNFGRDGTLALSGLLEVRVDETGRILGGQWRSLAIRDEGVPTPDSSDASAKLVRKLSEQDFKRTWEMDAKGRFGDEK